MKTHITPVRFSEWLALGILIICELALLGVVKMPTGAVDAVSRVYFAPPVVRVVAPRNERVYTTISPYGPGFEQELVARFAEEQNYRVQLMQVDSPLEAWVALETGKADLIVGFGGDVPSTVEDPVAAGPEYATSRPVLVHSARKYGLRQEKEMCEEPILTTSKDEVAYVLAAHQESENCLPWSSSSDEMKITPILDTLKDNRARFAMLDEADYSLWQPFYPQVKPTKSMDAAIPYRWFWRSGNYRLHRSVTAFWEAREQDSVLVNLTEKYFGFLPEDVDYYDVHRLVSSVRKRLPQYSNYLQKYAEKNNIDPLLVASVMYQESRFNPNAVSRTGVRGLMQLTKDTATLLNVNRLDPEESIKGGTKYLKFLWTKMEKLELKPWDRWFFTLAAYNVGLGHVYDAAELARTRGGTGKTWSELKEVLPLLAWQKYYSKTKYGYCRGFEAVDYVENIRYYYYILSGLVRLSRPEAEHLGPLRDATPVSWPTI